MKMIDVLSLLAKGEIEENTTLIVSNGFKEFEYKYRKIYRTFVDEDLCKFDGRFNIDKDFLDSEVKLIPPESNKYQLKLYKDDNLSYVTRSYCEKVFNYDLGSKTEVSEFITKFTQDEIDDDKFLKFIEMHGIKEKAE